MSRRTTYIVVEGPHDTAFVGKLLREGPLHLEPVPMLAQVDPCWTKLIPLTYPPKNPRTGDEEFKRVRVPEFFQSTTHSVAVEWAEGIDRVPALVSAITSILKPGKAVPNTIRDNSWIQPSTLVLPRVQGMADFIMNLVR